jgi:hypothetical protein
MFNVTLTNCIFSIGKMRQIITDQNNYYIWNKLYLINFLK